MSIEIDDKTSEAVVTDPSLVEVSASQPNLIVESDQKLVACEVDTEICVEAQIQEWVLTSDDIYIVQQFQDIPQWFEDIINEITQDPGGLIISDINDLKDYIDAVKEGFTYEVYRLDGVDSTQTVEFKSLKSSYEDTASIVTDMNSTYASKDYAEAISHEVVGAFIYGGEAGAWFEQSVSAIADVAYSSARSASSLNASMLATDKLVEALAGDIEVLKKQVDGQVVTWFVADKDYPTQGSPYYNTVGPILPSGLVNDDCKPYWCWLEGNICPEDIYNDADGPDDGADTRSLHTGDTFVWYKFTDDVKSIIATYRFGVDPDTGIFNWFLFEDDLATDAYNAALAAQETADGKITTFYQAEDPRNNAGVIVGLGDLWYDSDGFPTEGNLTAPFDNAGTLLRFNGTDWEGIVDKRITASVTRLDQATVTIDGVAVARGGLVVEATGTSGDTAIAGYIATADSDFEGASSAFKIFADKFLFSTNAGDDPAYAPFSIDTTVSPSQIKFNGIVNFDNPLNPVPQPDLDTYVEFNDLKTPLTTTIIDGANIRTGYLQATRIAASSIWTDGLIQSNNFVWDSNGITGFRLDSRSTSNWDIMGGRIYGGHIQSATMSTVTLEAATINSGTLNVGTINSGDLTEVKRPTSAGVLPANNTGGTGTLIVFNWTSIINAGAVFLWRGGTNIAHIAPTDVPNGAWQYTISYMDSPGNNTYYISNSPYSNAGSRTSGDSFTATMFKK